MLSFSFPSALKQDYHFDLGLKVINYLISQSRVQLVTAMSNTTIRQPTGFIRVDGTKLVDGDGNEIILRGAGLGGWMKYV